MLCVHQFYALTVTDWLPPALTILGVLILLGILILVWRDRQVHRAAAGAMSHEPPGAPLTGLNSVDPLQAASNDLYDNVQNVATHLEERTRSLTLLLAQAQKRIELLEELVTQSDRSDDLPDVAAAAPIRASSDVPSANHRITEVKQSDDGDDPNDPLRRAIYEQADTGASPVQIARNLNEQIGKVELILALRGL